MAEPATVSLAGALRRLKPRQTLGTRQAVLDELLEHFVEVQETLWSSEGYDAGEETGIQSTIFMSSLSYQALDRLLKRMRVDPARFANGNGGVTVQRLHWHLGAWYWRRQRYPVTPPLRVNRHHTPQGILVEEEKRYGETTVRMVRAAQVQALLVKAGLEWLDEQWTVHVSRRIGEPMVPDEILEAHLPGDEAIRT